MQGIVPNGGVRLNDDDDDAVGGGGGTGTIFLPASQLISVGAGIYPMHGVPVKVSISLLGTIRGVDLSERLGVNGCCPMSARKRSDGTYSSLPSNAMMLLLLPLLLLDDDDADAAADEAALGLMMLLFLVK